MGAVHDRACGRTRDRTLSPRGNDQAHRRERPMRNSRGGPTLLWALPLYPRGKILL